MSAEIEAGQAMVDRAVSELVAGQLSVADAAKVKLFCTEMQGRVVDRCLQLFGGYGYMMNIRSPGCTPMRGWRASTPEPAK
jgi:acyl-CoA dehydrogenase